MNGAQKYIEKRVERIPESGCWIWTKCLLIGPLGYGRAYFNDHAIYAHRLSWQAYRGPIPGTLNVLHHCDIPECCNPHHLFLGTHKDNKQDSMHKRRHASGARHGMKKLTAELIPYILASNKSGAALSRELHVDQSTINRVKRGEAWKEHLYQPISLTPISL